jgi:hypothetical protein
MKILLIIIILVAGCKCKIMSQTDPRNIYSHGYYIKTKSNVVWWVVSDTSDYDWNLMHSSKVTKQYHYKGTGTGYTVSDPCNCKTISLCDAMDLINADISEDNLKFTGTIWRLCYCKDTFIEISTKRWYNYKTHETRDSTDFYRLIDLLIDSYQLYRKETHDSSFKTHTEINDFLFWLTVKYKM